MTGNTLRVGNFTSSEIVALMSNGKKAGEPGKPFYTYIEECNYERRLGKAIDVESNARPLSWGKLCEKYVFENKLDTSYRLCSTETIQHPTIDCWVGSPDGEKFDDGKTVIDEKCPMTLKSFCQLVDPLYKGLTGINAINAIRFGVEDEDPRKSITPHKDGEKFYIQLVSNSILTNSKYAELIIYCPYKEDLEAIREMASMIDDPLEQRKYYWIAQAQDDELPWLIRGGVYKDLNKIRFEVPKEDKIKLTERVNLAKGHLVV